MAKFPACGDNHEPDPKPHSIPLSKIMRFPDYSLDRVASLVPNDDFDIGSDNDFLVENKPESFRKEKFFMRKSIPGSEPFD